MAKDWVCCKCGESFDKDQDGEAFEGKYLRYGWDLDDLKDDYCFKCACEKAEEALTNDYEYLSDVVERRCEVCGSKFIVGEAREEFHYMVHHNYPDGLGGDFDPYKCRDCNLDVFADEVAKIEPI